ncbi:antifreeze protein [Rhodobacter calidifons]|uniref:Antifreeze protein n=1 Tax=Rhodobacter calidifons TaxID=2715277 RepID=A0ABX0GD40_9RHOB|nr:antifreeze protein [Rhodobacter calidifons]NHB78436.1 antifreeze protein [Rhodobacter calidifons]
MYPMMTPARMISLSLKTGMMLMEAQMVIGMRMMGMMGMWRVHPSENARMSSEKVAAANASAVAASKAIMAGKPPAVIAEAALKPIARRTRSNVKRLAARGPGKP